MRSRDQLLAAFVGIAVVAGPKVLGESSSGVSREVLESFFRLRLVAATLDTYAVTEPLPGPTPGLVPLAWLRGRLPADRFARPGTIQDAWGSPLYYWSDGVRYALLSYGADRRPQFDYDPTTPYLGVPRAWVGTEPADDLMIVDGITYRGPFSRGETVVRAAAELRAIGTAMESWAVDYNLYPGPVEPIDAVARVEADLEPIYIRVLPRVDPWGSPYRVWSDRSAYAIVSYGSDGKPDLPYDTWTRADFDSLTPLETTWPEQDLLFVAGRFVRSPKLSPSP